MNLQKAVGDGRGASVLREYQRLNTSGARTALPFALDAQLFLAVPQLAVDIPDTPASMNGGDSDVEMIIYRWDNGAFAEAERLRVPGGEDVLLFELAGRVFLATASVRTGHGPYDLDAFSTIYERKDGAWRPFQQFATFAAKQWHYFSIDNRHFLALAQGVTLPHVMPKHPRESRIFEWREGQFTEFQVLHGCWGYNFAYFECAGIKLLAYADHTGESLLLRWDGTAFVVFQSLIDRGGRAFKYFEQDGGAWLVLAAIDGASTLYQYQTGQFVSRQVLGGVGGREWELFRVVDQLFLVRICFIEGSPASPKTDLKSQLFRWTGAGFEMKEEFPTFGGTDAAFFAVAGKPYLAVSNSLTAEIRFRQDTIIYEIVP